MRLSLFWFMALSKNFAKVQVSIGYNESATSIALESGHGAKLPSGAYFMSWWDSTLYPDPSDDPNAEVVRVSSVSGNNITVARGQQGTAATTKNTANSVYKMTHGPNAYDAGFLPLISSFSNYVYLDSVNGQDATAQIGNPLRPYATFPSAFAAMTSGSTMLIKSLSLTVNAVTGSDGSTDTAPFKIDGKNKMKFIGVGRPDIFVQGSGNVFSIHNSSEILFENLRFHGSGDHVVTSTPSPIYAIFDIRPTNASTDITWKNCSFHDYENHAIAALFEPKPHRRMKVLDCHFENGGAYVNGNVGVDGAAVVSLGSDVLVQGCTFYNILRGIELEGQGPHNNVQIIGNSFHTIWNFGIMVFAGYGTQSHFRNLVIANNTFENVHHDTVPTGTTTAIGACIYATGGRNYSITGNVFRDSYNGVFLYCTETNLDNVVISNNIFETFQNQPIQLFQFHADTVAGRTIKRVLISGNIIHVCSGIGILFRGTETTITGNSINDANYYGIQLMNDGANILNPCLIRITNNQIRNSTTAQTQQAVAIGTNYYATLVHNNNFQGTAIVGFLNNGTNTVSRYNDV